MDPSDDAKVERSTDLSAEQILRAKDGDAIALQELMARYLPALSRWARGRLPTWARDSMNTEDVVQDVFLRTLVHFQAFDPRGPGAMAAYLRQAVLHRIRDEIRKVKRRPGRDPLGEERFGREASPHEELEASELQVSYEAALERLRDEDREAIIARVELKLPYREVAVMLGKPSEAAAQMAVSRALIRLAREMGRTP